MSDFAKELILNSTSEFFALITALLSVYIVERMKQNTRKRRRKK